MFPVVDVTKIPAVRPEILGSKTKEWILPPTGAGLLTRPYLFKEGRPGTGENWAEKIACEVAEEIELPCAHYDLALRNGIQGVISEQIMPDGASLALGNLLLPEILPGYEQTKRFGQTDYRLSSVLNLVGQVEELGTPKGAHVDLPRPVDFFVGYLLLDVLIGNTDRHHENWGVVVERDTANPRNFLSWLAPTFDHASCLGRAELDSKRTMRLTTGDRRATVAAYVARARTAFYSDTEPRRILTSLELLGAIYQREPHSTRFWGSRICALNRVFFQGLFNQIGPEWITEPAVEFAIAMLILNQQAIREALND